MQALFFKVQFLIRFRFLIMLFALLGISIECLGQHSNPPSQNPVAPNVNAKLHYWNGTFVNEKSLPNGVISETVEDQYPSKTFHFHDDRGKEVKAIREDQFPISNPVFELPFPKNTDKNTSSSYFNSLSEFNDKTGKEQPLVSISSKVNAFKTLKAHNLYVKRPETATDIIGGPLESLNVITPTSGTFLVHCETASIYYKFAKENNDAEGNLISNSLLDCTYITIYDHLGDIMQELLISGKLIKTGLVSDDGKYLFCGYSVGNIWDEGTSTISDGFIMIDLQTKAITPIDIPGFRECSSNISGFFSNDYFQMQCEGTKFLYVNPYTRSYYSVFYEWEKIKGKRSLLYTSFMPFEGLKVDLSQYQKQSY